MQQKDKKTPITPEIWDALEQAFVYGQSAETMWCLDLEHGEVPDDLADVAGVYVSDRHTMVLIPDDLPIDAEDWLR